MHFDGARCQWRQALVEQFHRQGNRCATTRIGVAEVVQQHGVVGNVGRRTCGGIQVIEVSVHIGLPTSHQSLVGAYGENGGKDIAVVGIVHGFAEVEDGKGGAFCPVAYGVGARAIDV